MAVRIKVTTTGIRQATETLRGIHTRGRDFRSVFRWVRRELEEANRENFRANGIPSGRAWPPLSQDYADWKLANYGPLPTLIRTGDLYRDLVFLRGRPNDIGRTSATFGTDLPYAQFHQAGTANMPQRKIVFAPDFFAERIGRVVLDYLVYDKDPLATPLGALRSLFRQ